MPIVQKQGLTFFNSYVDFGNGSSLNLSNNLSASVLFNLNPFTPSLCGLLAKCDPSIGDGWWICLNGNALQFIAKINGTWSSYNFTSNVNRSQIVECSFTYDGSFLSLYLNGSLVLRQYTPGGIATNTKPVRIGSDSLGNNKLAGQVYTVRIYSRFLYPEEVAGNFRGSPARAGLVGEWLMLEGSGSTVHDTSGYGNHGTITGATWNIPQQQRQQAASRIKAAPVKGKKNLLPDFTKWTLNSNAQADVNNLYHLLLYATASDQKSYTTINVTPNTTYTLHVTHNAKIDVWGIQAGAAIVSPTSNNSVTFNSGANTSVSITFSNGVSGTSGTYNFTNPQLEAGSIATPFVPYQAIPDNKAAAR